MLQALARFFNDGGVFMWVILSVFAIASAVVIERIVYYFIINRGDPAREVSEIARLLNENSNDQAKKVAYRRKTPVFVLIQTALERYLSGMEYEEIQEGIETSAIKEIPKMTQRLNYLSLFANIGTLLGLLGTIVGLQTMFASLASVEAAKKASMLASGIAQAMNTTAFGLIVAIPCMVMYTFLHNKQQQLTKDLDEAIVTMMGYLKRKKA